MRLAIYGMIFMGAALMVYNIYGFTRFAGYVRGLKAWTHGNGILYVPIVLLVMFLLGYLVVGAFGKPDIIMAGILFGGSIFVFIMYRLLNRVTQQIVAGERLEAELMAAEESNRAKNSFLASISHEMRTPINVILGLDTMALKRNDITPNLRTLLERIGNSSKHLAGLIDNILDMNTLEAGEFTIKENAFPLNEMLDQINAIIATESADKGLNYEVRVSEAVNGSYLGDEIQLERVLMSILDNAVKYTQAPGMVRLSVECADDDGDMRTLRFTVSDTGIGIDPAFLPKIFEVFTQEDESFTNQYGGSGMGLAISKRIVERMGGSISATSVKNHGTTFTVLLPMKIAKEMADEAAPAGASVSLAGRRVLVVEDIDDNAEIVMDLLELEDVACERAENGQIALEMVARSEPDYYDAILMDLRMPVMDGMESARRIRALDRADARTMPIIALTANAFESDVQRSLDAGMNEHLAKPADADELYDALKRWIGEVYGEGGKKT